MYLFWAKMQREFIAQLPAELGDVHVAVPVLRDPSVQRRRRAVARLGRPDRSPTGPADGVAQATSSTAIAKAIACRQYSFMEMPVLAARDCTSWYMFLVMLLGLLGSGPNHSVNRDWAKVPIACPD